MKKLIIIIAIINCQFFIVNSFSQTPQSFKYQSVVRDASGVLAVNRIISIRTSILAGSASGSSDYTETQTLSTNDYGVVSLNIGAGTVVSGNFATINWGATDYFVKTELDINGGSVYVFMGTSQILSVPYALYAEKAGNSNNDHDTSATNELQTLSVVGSNLSISNGNTVVLPPDADGNPTNELQNLSLIGDSLHISNGNAIYLSGTLDLDASPTNELQNLTINNGTVSISQGNNIHLPDSSATNELQNLSLAGATLGISNGNSVTLPDASSTNELQNLSLAGATLGISNGNSVTLPDASPTNELQNLSINGGTLHISIGNSITLPDSSATNELQNIIVTNDTLISISQGNSAYINTTRSLKFPEGTDGIPFTLYIPSPPWSYIIPSDKNLYITLAPYPYYSGVGLPVFPAGTTLSSQNSGAKLCGILVNKTANIQVINSDTAYTVPNGKYFYLKSSSVGGHYSIGGYTYTIGQSQYDIGTEIIILPPNTIIDGTPGLITGYLK